MSRSTPSEKPSLREVEKEVRKLPTDSLVAWELSEMEVNVPSTNLAIENKRFHAYIDDNKLHICKGR